MSYLPLKDFESRRDLLKSNWFKNGVSAMYEYEELGLEVFQAVLGDAEFGCGIH